MEFNIFDIYTDASIDLNRRVGCAGALVVNRKKDEIVNNVFGIKLNATNNMSEIIAIWLGIYQAINLLYTEQTPFHVNLFSDSQISLFGMREWIYGWIKNRKGNSMIASSGVVANQEWFRDCYHAILASGIKMKLFHQKGHVNVDSSKSLFEADRMFRTSNINSLRMIGSTPQIISKYNNIVDNETRKIVQTITAGNDPYYYASCMRNVLVVGDCIPMEFEFGPNELEIYKSQISGGLNYPKFYNGGV